jgi:hypothetical protein
VVVSENAAVRADTPAISHVDGLGQREVSGAQLRSQLRGRRNFGLGDPGQFTKGKRTCTPHLQPRLQAAARGALGGPVGQAIAAIVTLGKGTVTNQVPGINSISTLVFS